MAMLKREVRPSYKPLILSQQDIEAAQKLVADAVNTAANKSQRRGQYNSYSKKQRAMIGKYAAENAAKHYSTVWGIPINESTARTPLTMKSISAHQGMFGSLLSGNLLLCSGQVF